jgi:hypothetical protein
MTGKEKFLQHLYDNAHNFEHTGNNTYKYKKDTGKGITFSFSISKEKHDGNDYPSYVFSATKRDYEEGTKQTYPLELSWEEREALYEKITSEDADFKRINQELDI